MNRIFIFFIFGIIGALVLSVSSCSRIGTGEVGIVLDFNRQVKEKAIINAWEFHLLDQLIIVDSTQIRAPILNAKAKDIDGILFQDIDAQITYNIREENAPHFFKLTKELDSVEGHQTLGFRIVSKEAKNALVKSFSHFKAIQASTDKAQIEAKTLQMLTEELDRRFPNTFIITDVNIDQALLDPNVEKVLQSQALIDSEKRTINAQMELQKQKSEMFERELMEIKNTANKAGISIAELLKYKNDKERNRVLSELARNNSNALIQIKE